MAVQQAEYNSWLIPLAQTRRLLIHYHCYQLFGGRMSPTVTTSGQITSENTFGPRAYNCRTSILHQKLYVGSNKGMFLRKHYTFFRSYVIFIPHLQKCFYVIQAKKYEIISDVRLKPETIFIVFWELTPHRPVILIFQGTYTFLPLR